MKITRLKPVLLDPKDPGLQTGNNLMIFILISMKNFCNTILYIIFQHGWEPVLIKYVVFLAINKRDKTNQI